MTTVIVFGPTGQIASVAARTAQDQGAKVFLAMRDPQKSIPGLSSEQEQDGGFERVHADLTRPDTVAAAAKASGAKRAFIYVAHGTKDNMKATLEALKSAGVGFVVLLSSFTIQGEPEDVAATDLIAHYHAQIEISLDQTFGRENYVAVRPGTFATNLLRFKPDIDAGEVELAGPDFEFDAITAEDIGKVSGTILVHGSRNGQQRVYLYGPQLISNRDAIAAIGKALGKQVKVTPLNEQEAVDQLTGKGTPKPFAEYLVRLYQSTPEEMQARRSCYDEGILNVELYTGKPATRFQEWLEAYKEIFSA